MVVSQGEDSANRRGSGLEAVCTALDRFSPRLKLDMAPNVSVRRGG